jgi:hypothetical protein
MCPRTLRKIHTFIESQQNGSKVKQFFRQGEMNTLLKDCKNGLTQGLDFFRVSFSHRLYNNSLCIILSTKLKNMGIIADVSKMQEEAEQRHQEVLGMINGLSDTTSSDRASMVCNI